MAALLWHLDTEEGHQVASWWGGTWGQGQQSSKVPVSSAQDGSGINTHRYKHQFFSIQIKKTPTVFQRGTAAWKGPCLVGFLNSVTSQPHSSK